MKVFRLTLALLLFFSIFVSFQAPVYATALLEVLWEFEDDYTADNNPSYNGIPYGTVNFVDGMIGRAVHFNGGLGDGLHDPSVAHIESTKETASSEFNRGFSVMGWINPDSSPDPLSGATFLGHDQTCCSIQNYGFGVWSRDGKLGLGLKSMSGRMVGSSDPGLIAPGEWTHVAVTWDGSPSGGIQVYINCDAVNTNIELAGFVGLNTNGLLPFRIGADHTNSANQYRGYSGSVDHLSVWKGVLTAGQIQQDCMIESIPDKLNRLKDMINRLYPDTFKNNPDQRVNALLNKIDAIIESFAVADMETDPTVQDELYGEAIDKLENDIRAKMDGCFGGNDKNDWITDCGAQDHLNLLLDDVVAAINGLINGN